MNQIGILTALGLETYFSEDLREAQKLQQSLFPQTLPAGSGLDFFGRCRTARAIGGDYYDYLSLPNDGLGLAVGDVSGKGSAAALVMAQLNTLLRRYLWGTDKELSALVSAMNREVRRVVPAGRYISLFFARYSPRDGILSYVNAGHISPLLIRHRRVEKLDVGGLPLGILPHPPAHCEASVTLVAGDVLVALSDGVTDAVNAEDYEFPYRAEVTQIVRANRNLSAQQLVDAHPRRCRFVHGR